MISLCSSAHAIDFEAVVREVVDRHEYVVGAKTSESKLTKSLELALSSAGFTVDAKDRLGKLLPPRVSAWRYGAWVPPTPGRREIDMVVYWGDKLVALLESEEDISDVNRDGSPDRYFVQSLATTSRGDFFLSYKSLERMAVASYIVKHGSIGISNQLEALHSDNCVDHNPLSVPMFITLACGWNKRGTRWRAELLEPRLVALGCKIIARE